MTTGFVLVCVQCQIAKMLARYNVLAFISKHRNAEVTEALVYCCCACAQDEDSLKKIFQLFLKRRGIDHLPNRKGTNER